MVIILGIGLVQSCSERSPQSPYMVELLEETAISSSTWRNPYMHNLRVMHFDSIQKYHPDISRRQQAHFEKALEQLYAGHTEKAITTLEDLSQKMPLYQSILGAEYVEKSHMIRSCLAVAHLRLAEQKNCILNHTAASCIIPISKEGQHAWKYGSLKAIEYYEEILDQRPTAYDAMWLMNIAHMTLGTYPKASA